MEIWKDVVGYEGLYEVSNTGKVRSLNYRLTGKSKELSQRRNNYGYLTVLLSTNGVCKRRTVHRLVAEAFIENTCEFCEVNHIDENKLNNNVTNLEWCTHEDNVKRYFENHPCHGKNRKHSDKYQKRMDLEIVQKTLDGRFVKTWPNSRTIFVETGMSDWSISECCRGKRTKAYGYIWQYAN